LETAEVRSKGASVLSTRIGRFLSEDGKFEDAEHFYNFSLDIDKNLLGKEHQDTLTSMNNLASTYRYQGKLGEVAEPQEKVLEVRRRTPGEEHPETLTNLAMIYKDLTWMADATDLMKK
jgi:tetratricopeptide (TPR) repeat protein